MLCNVMAKKQPAAGAESGEDSPGGSPTYPANTRSPSLRCELRSQLQKQLDPNLFCSKRPCHTLAAVGSCIAAILMLRPMSAPTPIYNAYEFELLLSRFPAGGVRATST